MEKVADAFAWATKIFRNGKLDNIEAKMRFKEDLAITQIQLIMLMSSRG
jgi:hypothetical protein